MVLIVATASQAQFIKQGTILGGGALSFTSVKDKNSDNHLTDFSLMPWAGYLVIDNLAIGGMIDANVQSSKSGSGATEYKQSQSTTTFGPVVQYYLDNGLFVHGQFGIGGGKSKSTSAGTTITQKQSASNWRLGLGYAIRITDTVLLQPIVGYGSQSYKPKGGTKETYNGFFLVGAFTVFFHSTN